MEFKKLEADLEAAEAAAEPQAALLESLSARLAKFLERAKAPEDSRIYGPQMIAKIFAAQARFEALQAKVQLSMTEVAAGATNPGETSAAAAGADVGTGSAAMPEASLSSFKLVATTEDELEKERERGRQAAVELQRLKEAKEAAKRAAQEQTVRTASEEVSGGG